MNDSTGTLIYSNNPYKLIVLVDNEIGRYYRALIPKYLDVRKQFHDSHISVIRNENPINMGFWGSYHNQEINFEYESNIYNDETYYWLNAYSPKLEEIRQELGLQSTSQFTRSPDGAHKFHITIGNIKHKS